MVDGVGDFRQRVVKTLEIPGETVKMKLKVLAHLSRFLCAFPLCLPKLHISNRQKHTIGLTNAVKYRDP